MARSRPSGCFRQSGAAPIWARRTETGAFIRKPDVCQHDRLSTRSGHGAVEQEHFRLSAAGRIRSACRSGGVHVCPRSPTLGVPWPGCPRSRPALNTRSFRSAWVSTESQNPNRRLRCSSSASSRPTSFCGQRCGCPQRSFPPRRCQCPPKGFEPAFAVGARPNGCPRNPPRSHPDRVRRVGVHGVNRNGRQACPPKLSQTGLHGCTTIWVMKAVAVIQDGAPLSPMQRRRSPKWAGH